MIKFLTIGVLAFLFYRIVTKSTLPPAESPEDDQYVDYEELD